MRAPRCVYARHDGGARTCRGLVHWCCKSTIKKISSKAQTIETECLAPEARTLPAPPCTLTLQAIDITATPSSQARTVSAKSFALAPEARTVPAKSYIVTTQAIDITVTPSSQARTIPAKSYIVTSKGFKITAETRHNSSKTPFKNGRHLIVRNVRGDSKCTTTSIVKVE